ncbi:MAG: 50S ribosomal protein L4 [Candidatus Doudnabacteria bacterium]|nr:50S ribosomal protein L4 [Candidatus Doudnabacteria bacterium]
MTKAAVYNKVGEKVSEMELNQKVFGLDKIDPFLVHFAVRAQRNNLRRAIGHVKNRGEVSGGGKKPWKQKGTGRARVGSIRSPLWRGGGVTFGPRSDRNFSMKLNKNAFRKALFTILSDKLLSNKLVVLDDFPEVEKTSQFQKTISEIAKPAGLGIKVALIIPKSNKKIMQAARNLGDFKVLAASQLNIIDLLKHDLVITEEALSVIEESYLK